MFLVGILQVHGSMTFRMRTKCSCWEHVKQSVPVLAMFLTCSYLFPSTLAPSERSIFSILVAFSVTSTQQPTLGARGHLPGRTIVSSWWVLKQFAPILPNGSMLGSFQKYPAICPPRTHQVKGEFFMKEPTDLLQTDLAGTFWVFFESTHHFAPTVPSG